jgi:hypothetical protein
MKNAYKLLARKPEGKRPFGTPSRRLENNIRTNFKEIIWKVWTGFIWLRNRSCNELM